VSSVPSIPPEGSARQGAERAVLNAIRRIIRSLRLAATTTQSSLGISAAQLYVLRHLAQHDVASIAELASETLTDRSSVAAVVERLVERGLARRTQALDDRRRARVEITTAGAHLAGQASPPPTDLILTALDRLTDAQLGALADSMTTLVRAMGLESTPAEMLFEERERAGRRRRSNDG
jgi:DNA-binding MarR family transcriptional regulator